MADSRDSSPEGLVSATSGEKKYPNFEVDYVINYTLPPPSSPQPLAEAEASFTQLIHLLSKTGFAVEVRPGRAPSSPTSASSLLIFLRIASHSLLENQVYRYRVQDWLYGVRTAAPGPPGSSQEPITDAERLRLAYLLVTKPVNEGGAGITPGIGQWRFVKSVFPLHDREFNKQWIKDWSTKYTLDDEDLLKIRNQFGEKVAFYFAFLQSYFQFLLFPAAFGASAWLILGGFSWFYAVVNCLWGVIFFEHWKVKEVDLAVQWGVRGVGKIQLPRPQFKFEMEGVDPVTGEIVKVYSPYKRLARQLLQVPFAGACVVVLGGLILGCFSIEIFITEVYMGPFKQYLTFLPTVLLTIFMPTFTTLLTKLAERLTDLENYETVDAHQASFVQKIFVLNFITSYLGIFLTAFVYVPFGKILVPHLDVFRLTAQQFTAEGKPLPVKEWVINSDRLRKQVIYFTVTAQIVNFATEVIVPYAKRKIFKTVEKVQTEIKKTDQVQGKAGWPSDAPEEHRFLKRVREEAELEQYDVTIDYREMVIQFGYLSLFSVVWPLTGCSFLVNNWVEARSDAMKIAANSQRPIPWRSDSIGPWLNALGFLSWLGSITSAALVYLFNQSKEGQLGVLSGDIWDLSGWALLLSILCSEHVYLAVQLVVRSVIERLDSPGFQKERAERFAMRKELLERMVEENVVDEQAGHSVGEKQGEGITREALEEEARSLSGLGPEKIFWLRQRGAGETVEVGRGLIQQVLGAGGNSTKGRQQGESFSTST